MKINSIEPVQKNNPWLQMVEVNYEHKGKSGKWFFVTRDKEISTEPCNKANAVVVVARHFETPESKPRLVVIKEYRIPLRDYEYGFPAGLIDEGEIPEETAIRELKEETGLITDEVIRVSFPVFSSAGLTDEAVHMVFLDCHGEISNEHLGNSEDIETILMDQKELKKAAVGLCGNWSAKAWCLIQGLDLRNSFK